MWRLLLRSKEPCPSGGTQRRLVGGQVLLALKRCLLMARLLQAPINKQQCWAIAIENGSNVEILKVAQYGLYMYCPGQEKRTILVMHQVISKNLQSDFAAMHRCMKSRSLTIPQFNQALLDITRFWFYASAQQHGFSFVQGSRWSVLWPEVLPVIIHMWSCIA